MLIAIGAWTQVSAENTTRWVEHSNRVRLQIDALIVAMERVIGVQHRIPVSQQAIHDVPLRADALVLLVSDNPPQEALARRIAAMTRNATALQRLSRSPRSPARSLRSELAIDEMHAEVMARFIALIEPFSNEEDRLGIVRNATQRQTWILGDVIVLATAIVVGCIIVLLNLAFGREIVTRLTRLAAKANSFRDGDTALEPEAGRDEIADLDRCLYAMMQTIEARESEARRYKLLTEFTRDIILFIRRNDFRIIDANASAVEAYGYAQDELRGLHLRNLRAETALPRRMEDRFAEIDRSAVVYETVHRRKDGTEFPVEVSAAKTELDGETVVMLIIRDISGRKMTEAATIRAQVSESARIALELEVTERKEVERRLAFAAFHDDLTKLPNRALFMDRLQQTLARQQRYPDATAAILFLDIDRFKVINDSLGHAAGDSLLIELARRLETCLRSGDTLARFGGDEFTFLLERVDDERSATTAAERILNVFDASFAIAGREVFASGSIGIVISMGGSTSAGDLVRDADIAMYDAKDRGKQRYAVFTPALLERVILLQEIETDLRCALERAEFRLAYQPIFSLKDGRMVGFEALIRWQHPKRGLLAPDAFIEAAEATGAIVAIGEWVLGEACRQLQAWTHVYESARALTVSVNVSPRQLATPGFVASVGDALDRSQLDAQRLNIEITESAIIGNIDTVRGKLEEIRLRGARVHLDDFGTGYSSLSYLHRLPIDVLKIDRTFVSSGGDGLASRQIVETILALAEHLSIDVTAEGIETVEQCRALTALGCLRGQGYYFSRPLRAALCEALIVEQPRLIGELAR